MSLRYAMNKLQIALHRTTGLVDRRAAGVHVLAGGACIQATTEYCTAS